LTKLPGEKEYEVAVPTELPLDAPSGLVTLLLPIARTQVKDAGDVVVNVSAEAVSSEQMVSGAEDTVAAAVVNTVTVVVKAEPVHGCP
jgi:hypothetical protein